MLIRPATAADAPAIWSIIGPVIRAGETYTLDRDMSEEAALAYWMGEDRETFVAALPGDIPGARAGRRCRDAGLTSRDLLVSFAEPQDFS